MRSTNDAIASGFNLEMCWILVVLQPGEFVPGARLIRDVERRALKHFARSKFWQKVIRQRTAEMVLMVAESTRPPLRLTRVAFRRAYALDRMERPQARMLALTFARCCLAEGEYGEAKRWARKVWRETHGRPGSRHPQSHHAAAHALVKRIEEAVAKARSARTRPRKRAVRQVARLRRMRAWPKRDVLAS